MLPDQPAFPNVLHLTANESLYGAHAHSYTIFQSLKIMRTAHVCTGGFLLNCCLSALPFSFHTHIHSPPNCWWTQVRTPRPSNPRKWFFPTAKFSKFLIKYESEGPHITALPGCMCVCMCVQTAIPASSTTTPYSHCHILLYYVLPCILEFISSQLMIWLPLTRMQPSGRQEPLSRFTDTLQVPRTCLTYLQ